MTTKMQLVFRKGQGTSRPASGRPHVARGLDANAGLEVMLFVGIVEATAGELGPDGLLDFTAVADDGGLKGLMTRGRRPAPDMAGHDNVAAALTHFEAIPAPGYGALLPFGAMFARPTRFPSADGHEVHAVAGLLVVPRDAVAERVMFDLEGRGASLAVVGSRPVPGTFVLGSTPNHVHQMPIWGWQAEPRGFVSTLPLDVIDDVHALQGIRERGEPEPEGMRIAKEIVSFRREDPMYRAFLDFARDEGALDRVQQRWDSHPTAAELDAHLAMVRDVVERSLEARDRPPAP